MPTESHIHCFHTKDAVERAEGSFTFELPSGRLRNGAVRVALASCELPMTQYTIQESWNRLWLSEGLFVTESNRQITLAVSVGGRGLEDVPLVLPLRCNPCRVTPLTTAAGFVVSCEQPHGLFTDGQPRKHALRRARILGTRAGDVHLCRTVVDPMDDTTFVVRGVGLDASVKGAEMATLHTECTDAPADACLALAEAAAERPNLALRFEYDAAADRVCMAVRNAADEPARVTVRESALASYLGLSTTTQPVAAGALLAWPSEPTRFWDFVELTPGFYGPAHRPMCIGPPWRFPEALELAVNRFYFPVLSGEGSVSMHMLIFTDADGGVHRTRILPGRYSPYELAAHVGRGLQAVFENGGGSKDIRFEVAYERETFRFTCARRHNGDLVPCPFGILFNHPHGVDPARFGFDAVPLTGGTTYRSPHRVRAALRRTDSPHDAGYGNLMRVHEEQAQKRLRLHAVAPPTMVAVIREPATRASHSARVVTYVNGEAYAHGFAVGDTVSVAPFRRPEPAEGEPERGDASVASTDGALPARCTCLVLAVHGVAELTLACPPIQAFQTVKSGLVLVPHVRPWSVCFGKPGSLPASMLGFPERAVCWGTDGSTLPKRIAPFDAPYVHSFDHPDYVLITFSESTGASLEHARGGHTKQVFCKLTLYPLFREERMLPRDTNILGPQIGRFTLAFWNPDMTTPYHFNGAEFSFSLSFMQAVPDA